MNQPGAQNRSGNTAGGSGIAQGWPLPTRGARSRTTRQVNAQAGPSSQPAPPGVTRNEYPTPPPTYSSPAPAPDPALPAAPATQQSPASILERISRQLADNHDEMIEHLDENFDLIIRQLEGLNGTMRQIRDSNINTLSESFHSADEQVIASNDAGAPPAPTADPNVRAENAASMQPEPLAGLESYGSMYASTGIEIPRESAPLGRTPSIAETDSNLPPVAAGHTRQPLDPQPSVELSEEGSAPRERTLRRCHAFRSLCLSVDEGSNVAVGTGENASTSLDANRIFSRPASTVGAGVDQETGWQGPTAPLEVPLPASNAATNEEYGAEAVDTQAEHAEDPILTLVSCRETSELCPGTLQLIIEVGTDRTVRDGDHLFFLGGLDQAVQQLPGICAEREIEWSQLFLRIRRPVCKGQDSMLMIMRCLQPYMRYFLGVHLDMDAAQEVNTSERFDDDFARLLFLTVEGGVSRNRLLLFPLYNLRQLKIKMKMDVDGILDILGRSKMLDILQFDYQGRADRARGGRVGEVSQDATLPPAMHIQADNVLALLPLLQAAESSTTDLRLKINNGLPLNSAILTLFDRHPRWKLVC